MSGIVLVGAGGHARVVVEALARRGVAIAVYVDPKPAAWLDAPRHTSEAEAFAALPGADFAAGLAAVDPEGLARRARILEACGALGGKAVTVSHPDASIAPDAHVGAGAQVFALARLAADCEVGEGAIVNTGAIVEHGARVGAYAHVAPGAIVLGEAVIGRGAMIGAGAIVLPGARIADGAMVKAGTRVPR